MGYGMVHMGEMLGLGQDAMHLTLVQVCLRGVVVFGVTLLIIRCGDRRFLSRTAHQRTQRRDHSRWRDRSGYRGAQPPE
jgi:hypothetical protein